MSAQPYGAANAPVDIDEKHAALGRSTQHSGEDVSPEAITDEMLDRFNSEPIAAERIEAFAAILARDVIADALTTALNADGRSLRAIERETGLDKAYLSRLANGRQNCEIESLAKIALALGKSLRLEIV